MRDAEGAVDLVDRPEFEPFDVLLEEVVRGDVAAQRPRDGRRWLAAAVVLLGAAVVFGAWWAQRPAGDDGAAQDPDAPPAAVPKDLDELRAMLGQVRGIEVRVPHIASHARGDENDLEVAYDPSETATFAGPDLAAWREALAASTVTKVQVGTNGGPLRLDCRLADGRVLRGSLVRGSATINCVTWLDGAATPLTFAGTPAMYRQTPELLQLGEQAHALAERNGRRTRGEAASIDELRTLPAEARVVRFPRLDAEELRAELGRFVALERAVFRPEHPVATAFVEALCSCRTLLAIELPCRDLTADDLRTLARLPRLEELRLDGRLSDAAAAALPGFGAQLRRLGLRFPLHLVDFDSPRDQRTWSATVRAAAQLPQLEELDLTASNFACELLRDYPALRRLRLHTEATTAGSLSPLTALRLERLALSGVERPRGLAVLRELPRLRELSLRDCRVGDGDLDVLQGLSSLRRLDVTDTAITADGMAVLRFYLTECEVIGNPGRVSVPHPLRLRKGG
ncbi:MAG: hypothetical protein AB7O97_14415 [Planctomycetota bacterium]